MRCLGKNIKVQVNSVTICYSDEGPEEAPIVLFIHGFPFNKFMWREQVEALKDNYRVITYDLRGHGDSDIGNESFSIEIFTKDLIGLMDKLELDKVILCGLSLGGYIALNAITKHPHSFDAVILSNTQCTADKSAVREGRMEAIESIRKEGVEKYAEHTLKNLFAPESFTTKEKEIVAVKQMIINTSAKSLWNTLLALAERKEICGKLGDVEMPALILVGKEDKITPLTSAELMHEKMQNSSLFTIANAGHISNIENPTEFNNQLKKFLQRVAKNQFKVSAAASN
jgi:3-oxoadipate enol-lactonase